MGTHRSANGVKRDRRAGILLHPTSLPGPLGHGDFGHQAYRFIEFLNTNGFKHMMRNLLTNAFLLMRAILY